MPLAAFRNALAAVGGGGYKVRLGGSFVEATGGTVSTLTIDGVDYTLHAFTSSGTFTVTAPGDVDILVVGAGGAGGSTSSNASYPSGGGGGGGQVVYETAVSVSEQAYTITVGTTGSSSALSYTAIAGGKGGDGINGQQYGADGGAAGGGGGGALSFGGYKIGPATTGTYGGGAGAYVATTILVAGGGGGAGSAGADAIATFPGRRGGNGGNGVDMSPYFGTDFGATGYFAGGGGGGHGVSGSTSAGDGTHGGGNAASSGAGNPGTANTGGGGGGASGGTNTGGAGGTGIVLIKYLKAPSLGTGGGAAINGYVITSSMTATTNFNVGTYEINPCGLAFKSDGTKVYVVGLTNDTVYQFSLSTAWDISSASYDNKSLSVTAEGGSPQGVHFDSNGSYMWTVDSGSDRLRVYTLSTAWDISTGTAATSFLMTPTNYGAADLYVKEGGQRVFVAGDTSNVVNIVHQIDLATAYDASTASFTTSVTLNQPGGSAWEGIDFKADGTKMYLLTRYGGVSKVYQYTLSTPWVLSTATYDSVIATLNGETAGRAMRFGQNGGEKLFMVGSSTDRIYQYPSV